MIGFRKNEGKNCKFFLAPPPPQKVGKGAPISEIKIIG